MSETNGISLEQIKETEKCLLESICKFYYFEDFIIYQSIDFPNFYGGNGIEILNNQLKELEDWEIIFRKHFDKKISRHYTFTFEVNSKSDKLISEAKIRGYDIEIEAYMACDTLSFIVPLQNPNYYIKTIRTENEWRDFEIFYDEVSKENDWYDPKNGTKELFAKTRKTTERLDITWFGIYARTNKKILGSLGVFKNGNICRLQDVMVHPDYRRKKLATYLLSHVIPFCLESLKGNGLALIADTNYHAIDLYKKLGFKKFGEFASLVKFPSVH